MLELNYYPEDQLVLNCSIIGIQSHNYNSHGGVNNTVKLWRRFYRFPENAW